MHVAANNKPKKGLVKKDFLIKIIFLITTQRNKIGVIKKILNWHRKKHLPAVRILNSFFYLIKFTNLIWKENGFDEINISVIYP